MKRRAAAAACPLLETLEDRYVLNGAGFADHFFAPYVDATAWPPLDLASYSQNQGQKQIVLAFITADAATQAPAWDAEHSAASGRRLDEINQVRALGGDVMISFGGAAGTELANAVTDVNALTQAYQAVIDVYGLTMVDFDIEGAWIGDHASVDRRSAAIKNLQDAAAADGRRLEVWFTLPAMTSGLTEDGVFLLHSALNHGVKISGVNIMAMDYGDADAPNPDGHMGDYAIQSANGAFGQLDALYDGVGAPKSDADLWRMLGVTPMIGQNDVASERFRQSDARQLVDFAQAHGLGMIGMWSAGRDHAGPLGQLSGAHSGISQANWEFTQIFGAFGAPAGPTLTVSGASVTEGDTGTRLASFTVTLSQAAAETVTVSYATVNGTATATDYLAANGVLAFAPGETQKTIQVAVKGDLAAESAEAF